MAEHLTPPVRCAKRAVRCGARTTHAIELPNVKKIGGGHGNRLKVGNKEPVHTLLSPEHNLDAIRAQMRVSASRGKKRDISNKLRSFLSFSFFFFLKQGDAVEGIYALSHRCEIGCSILTQSANTQTARCKNKSPHEQFSRLRPGGSARSSSRRRRGARRSVTGRRRERKL